MPTDLKLAIIGAGPGGYVAAFHAADLGLKVTLIDRAQNPGGVCLYHGCIPSKALLHATKILSEAKEAKNFGIDFGEPKIDIEKLRAWKNGIVTKLTGGLGQLTKQRNISYIQGQARFLSSSTIEISKADGSTEALTFEKAIIATGSRPAALSFLSKSERIWDSTQALTLPEVPSSLLVVGGGYIGLELGSAYAALDAKVSVVEALPRLLGGADRDLTDVLLRRLKGRFTKIMTETKIRNVTEIADGLRVTFEDAKGQAFEETYSHLLVSVGRIPNSDGLDLQNTKVKIGATGHITVFSQRQTNDERIYAIGDVAGNPMLAHKASFEGKVAVEAIAGKKTAYDPKAIPAVIFTDPELAWCGLTEAEALEKGLAINVSKFPWAASGRALTLNRTDGATKIIADAKTERLLGVGIVGVNAGDLISEGALAIEAGLQAEDLALTIHPHPTLSETLMEAAEGVFGSATHILRPKK